MMGGRSSRIQRRSAIAGGFTIVETLIVLAVTGMLFVSFTTAIQGRQDKVRFQQAVKAAKSQIEQVMSETQSGYFPSTAGFRCREPGASGNLNFNGPPGSDNEQGTNKDCVFLGKVMQFGQGSGTDPEQLTIYSMAGLRRATDMGSSAATVVTELTETKPLQFGLNAKWARYNAVNIGAVGFISYFGQENGTVAGSQSIQVIPISGTDLLNADDSTINNNLIPSYANRNPAGGVQVCFASGTTDQSGLITIGAGGGMNSVKLEIKNNQDCS